MIFSSNSKSIQLKFMRHSERRKKKIGCLHERKESGDRQLFEETESQLKVK